MWIATGPLCRKCINNRNRSFCGLYICYAVMRNYRIPTKSGSSNRNRLSIANSQSGCLQIIYKPFFIDGNNRLSKVIRYRNWVMSGCSSLTHGPLSTRLPTGKCAQPHTKSGVAAVSIHRAIYTIILDLNFAVQLFNL